MSNVVGFGFCGVSTSARRFSSGQLCSAIRRTIGAYTTPSSVLTRCSSVESLLPSHLLASFGAEFLDPFPTFGGRASTDSPNSITFPRYGPPTARQNGRCASSPLKRGMAQAPCRTIHAINTLSVVGLRAVLHCFQLCALLSLQLFLKVSHCSVALMGSAGGLSNDCSFFSFGFHTFCPLDE